jgi:transcriptional regulator of arginine metabolism
MRSSRLKDLVGILRRGHASTQQEIVAELQAAGHEVTQATVSRDLQEIGAVKVRSGRMLGYHLPDEVSRTTGSELMERNLRRTLRDFALDVKQADSMVIVVTAPGHASAVARAIDLAGVEAVIGTVAGDDTIFVATPGADPARSLVADWETVSGNVLDDGTAQGEG